MQLGLQQKIKVTYTSLRIPGMTRHFLFTQWIQLKLQENMKSSIPLSLWYFFVVLTAKNILSEDSGSPWGNPIEFLETILYTQYLEPNRFKPCFLSVCSCSQFFFKFYVPAFNNIFSLLAITRVHCLRPKLWDPTLPPQKGLNFTKKWKCYLAYL